MLIELEILPSPEQAGARAAARVAGSLRGAIAERGVATLALSGGTTPGLMLAGLADERVEWSRVHIFQVDERVVAAHDASRNLKSMRAALAPGIVQSSRIHEIPVEVGDPELAAVRYTELLRSVVGTPPVLDLVQLGLGADGHTASLVPADAALEADGDVAATGVYQGLRRVTLTFPAINRARERLFLVTGDAKRAALRLLARGDRSAVASRVTPERTVVVADADAAGDLPDASRGGGLGGRANGG